MAGRLVEPRAFLRAGGMPALCDSDALHVTRPPFEGIKKKPPSALAEGGVDVPASVCVVWLGTGTASVRYSDFQAEAVRTSRSFSVDFPARTFAPVWH